VFANLQKILLNLLLKYLGSIFLSAKIMDLLKAKILEK